MILETYEKQPAEIKDYDIDYSEWLASPADTISDATATVVCLSTDGDTALAINGVDITTKTVKLWISGGTSGEKYKITINVMTNGGRLDQSELIFKIKDR